MTDYFSWMAGWLPGWLQSTYGKVFWSVQTFFGDLALDAAKVAVKSRIPSTADSTALGYVGDNRNIERYFFDTDDTYRARLETAWDIWNLAGSRQRITDAVAGQGFTNVVMVSWRDAGGGLPGAGGLPPPWEDWWSGFVVMIGPPAVYSADSAWGTGTWGDVVPGHLGNPAGPGVWGINATAYEVHTLRESIRKWKDARDLCVLIFFVAGDCWAPVTPWANGTWGDSGPAIVIAGYENR